MHDTVGKDSTLRAIIQKEMDEKTYDRLTKADDKGEVVAEAALIAVAIEGTEGLDAAVLFVFFDEERSIVDEDLADTVA